MSSGVESNDLVAEDVVSWGDGGWDSDGAGQVVGHQSIRSPGTWSSSVVEETGLGDLEPLERGLVNSGAITTAVGEVVDDWTVVRLWPCVPVKVDVSSSLDWRGESGVLGSIVANDVASSELGWGNESEIGRGLAPSNGLWCGGHVWVGVDEVSGEAVRN